RKAVRSPVGSLRVLDSLQQLRSLRRGRREFLHDRLYLGARIIHAADRRVQQRERVAGLGRAAGLLDPQALDGDEDVIPAGLVVRDAQRVAVDGRRAERVHEDRLARGAIAGAYLARGRVRRYEVERGVEIVRLPERVARALVVPCLPGDGTELQQGRLLG